MGTYRISLARGLTDLLVGWFLKEDVSPSLEDEDFVGVLGRPGLSKQLVVLILWHQDIVIVVNGTLVGSEEYPDCFLRDNERLMGKSQPEGRVHLGQQLDCPVGPISEGIKHLACDDTCVVEVSELVPDVQEALEEHITNVPFCSFVLIASLVLKNDVANGHVVGLDSESHVKSNVSVHCVVDVRFQSELGVHGSNPFDHEWMDD